MSISITATTNDISVSSSATAVTVSAADSTTSVTPTTAVAFDQASITSSQTTVINSDAQAPTNFFGQRMIHTGGAITYTFAAVSSSDIGKSVSVINAGTDTITLSITTSKFYDLTAGVNPDFSGSGASSHSLLKGGVAEFIVAAADKVLVIGSGVI